MAILFKDMDLPKSCISDDEVCPILKADLCKAFPLVTASVIHQYFPQYFEQDVLNKGRLKDCPLVEVAICTEQQWIPCSERLPEKGEKVLASTKNTVFTQVFKGIQGASDSWWWNNNTIKTIYAWMPAPEPWKGEENEHTN